MSLRELDLGPGPKLRLAGWLGGTLGLGISLLGGCRGEDVYFDCEDQEAAFRSTAESEGALLDPLPKGEPYPVALKFSEDGLNRLLESVVDKEVPFTGELPFFWFSGPGTLQFEQTSDPVIELESLEGCSTCVLYSFDFNVVLVGANGEFQGAGIGSVDLRIPLELREIAGADEVVLLADYTRLRVQNLWLSAFGLETEEHEALVGAVAVLLEEEVHSSFGEVELLRLGSWSIGESGVKLLARKLLVFPEEDTLALAMQSNLRLPAGGGLTIDGTMPMGVPMTLTFDTALFQSMIERLLASGEVARVYDEDGKPDENGNYGVTFDSLIGSETQNRMNTQFKVWRFADGYCGYAVAAMDLDVDLDETGNVALTAGEVAVLSGQGSGAVAAEDDDLVAQNQGVVENFKTAVASNLGVSINYDALDVEGSTVIFETLAVDVEPKTLETWIDFFVVQNP
ncbi:hypothetical protein ACNOYE_00420 [Nannocystaceae bacterium ST9]